MKQSEILKVLSAELGVAKLDDVNKALKAKSYSTKFRITGPTLVHFGFTGLIKALTPDGVKVINTNKVNLIRYDDIETFAKAVPRIERKGPPKVAKPEAPKGPTTTKPIPQASTPKKPAAKVSAPIISTPKVASSKIVAPKIDEDEDYENDDDFDELADEADDVVVDVKVVEQFETKKQKKIKKEKLLHIPGSGSQFIPKKKR